MPKQWFKSVAKSDSIAETRVRAKPESQSEGWAESETGKILCVGNLPHQATNVILEAWFRASGVIPQAIEIVRDRVSGPAGAYALVRVPEKHHASWAIASCDGEYFLGRRLTVREFSRLREAV